MEEVEGCEYEAELRRFKLKLNTNDDTLQRFLTTYEDDVTRTLTNLRNITIHTLEDRNKVRQRIEEVRGGIKQREAELGTEREGLEKLRRELEKLTVTLQGKNEEMERQKEIVTEYIKKIKKEDLGAAEAKLENQRRAGQAESSIRLFKTHLGLDITCVRDNILILKFTQVSHSNPEAEYMLEMSLEGDNYRLLGSVPPLPSLPELQQELDASGNLVACIMQIRKLYQRMANKRQRE